MKLTRRKKTPTTPLLDMAPMIDVIFLLLIFFMCTSAISQMEADLQTRMPTAQARSVADDLPPIRVRVEQRGEAIVIECDGQRCDDFSVLCDRLRARRAIADVPVLVAGQQDVSWQQMVHAIDACYRAGLSKVAFSGANPS
jgi:biopolymer transport protein ExbD